MSTLSTLHAAVTSELTPLVVTEVGIDLTKATFLVCHAVHHVETVWLTLKYMKVLVTQVVNAHSQKQSSPNHSAPMSHNGFSSQLQAEHL